jgi:glycosyltransferase involved in cell wall biosynthesis
MNILFLSEWFPYPANNGSKLRIYNLLRGLSQQHEVTLLSFADQPDVNPNAPALRALCREVRVVPKKAFDPQTRRAHWEHLSLTPRSLVGNHSREMEESIKSTLSAEKYDLIIASQAATAAYVPALSGMPALFEELEIGVLYEQFAHAPSTWHRLRYGLTWAKYRHYLTHLLRHFGACTVVSAREHEMAQGCMPSYRAIEVIPNCVNLADYADVHTAPQPDTLVFTGSFRYGANYQAMLWFLREVFPSVLAQVPHACLRITGDHANLPLPNGENIILTGLVPDVRPIIASSWASIVPIHVGGGTRLKILEAMALRTPVISTSKGAEGLELQHDKHLLIADTPEAFAREAVRLLQEPGLRQQLTDNAYQLVHEKYDWTVVMPRFLSLVEHTAQS